MNNPVDIEARLWEYIDGLSVGEERSAVEQLIAENAAWKAKYQELLDMHQSLNLVELEQPSMRFTKNVMEEIARFNCTLTVFTSLPKACAISSSDCSPL